MAANALVQLTGATSKPKAKVHYPADHQVGMQVPKGGSDCAKCEYVSEDEKRCSNPDFVKWNGSKILPHPANQYCCDFFETGDQA